jgi:Flp pilus assembly protein TadG
MEQTPPVHNCALHEKGSALVEMALILPLLLLLFMGAVDLGRAFYYSNTVARAAEAGALYGSQNPTDTTGMIDASNEAMSSAFGSAQDMSGLNATASYGCECNGGTGQSPACATTPSCTTNEVYYVTVTANATYNTLLPWPGIPDAVNLSSTVTMRGGA